MRYIYAGNGFEYAVDDVSGALLDPTLVHEGRATEMEFFNGMRVYDRVPRDEQRQTGGKVIGTKWIDVNKGDIDRPNIRCRLVGKEFRTTPDDASHASTPPLEALRVILSRAATWGPQMLRTGDHDQRRVKSLLLRRSDQVHVH